MDKPKRERTEAQKKATASMLAKLKENRDKGILKTGRKKKEVKNVVDVEVPESSESEQEVVVAPKEKVVVKEVIKEVPVEPKYLTKEDLHAFKNEIASLINPPSLPVQEKPMKKPKKVPVTRSTVDDEDEYEPEPQPAPVRAVAPKAVRQQPQALTGYSLLDKLLNR
jgi:hypothetical protein